MPIPPYLKSLLINVVCHQNIALRIGGSVSMMRSILQGIIQGKKLSPYIFIKLVDTVMKTSLLPMIWFVDDLLFICKRSELESAIQEIFDRLANWFTIKS